MDANKNDWSFWYSRHEETADEEVPRLADFFKDVGVSKVLDLGCGTGRHMIYFAEKGFEVYGFDFSSYAVKRAQQRLKAKKLTANLTVLDMRRNFPYTDGVFDAVVTIRVIHHAHLKTIKRSVAEVKRVLKEGGYFYADVPSRSRNRDEKVKFVEPGTRVPLEGSEKGIPHHDFTEKEVYRVFRGFRIQELQKKDTHFHILAEKKT